jgi:hypothetical protein
VGEEGHVVGPLAQQVRVLDRAEHADRPVANLPAVAVRAVQEIAAPTLAGALDPYGQHVAGARGQEHVASLDDSAAQQAQRVPFFATTLSADPSRDVAAALGDMPGFFRYTRRE